MAPAQIIIVILPGTSGIMILLPVQSNAAAFPSYLLLKILRSIPYGFAGWIPDRNLLTWIKQRSELWIPVEYDKEQRVPTPM